MLFIPPIIVLWLNQNTNLKLPVILIGWNSVTRLNSKNVHFWTPCTMLFIPFKMKPQEADYNEENWQENFWGLENYNRLQIIKKKWDNEGLFYCHNCVGSEEWEEGGMCRIFD